MSDTRNSLEITIWLGLVLIATTLLAQCSLGAFRTTLPPDMIIIPNGKFTIGAKMDDPDARPTRTLTLGTFYIDKHEVTNAQYVEYLNTVENLTDQCDGHVCFDPKTENPDSHILYRQGHYVAEVGYSQHPVTNISWYGAQAYCRYYNQRLPTEAEWEKAARGTDARLYPWGDHLATEKLNAGQRVGDTTPVGNYPAGTSPYGAYDMAGNVWEWVADWYQAYPGSSYDSPFFGEKYKVVRGGSWNHPDVDARTPHRDIAHPARRIHVVGFRCARDP